MPSDKDCDGARARRHATKAQASGRHQAGSHVRSLLACRIGTDVTLGGANRDRAVVLFNRTRTRARITTTARSVGMPTAPRYYLHHLWSHCVSATTGTISTRIGGHGVSMTR